MSDFIKNILTSIPDVKDVVVTSFEDSGEVSDTKVTKGRFVSSGATFQFHIFKGGYLSTLSISLSFDFKLSKKVSKVDVYDVINEQNKKMPGVKCFLKSLDNKNLITVYTGELLFTDENAARPFLESTLPIIGISPIFMSKALKSKGIDHREIVSD